MVQTPTRYIAQEDFEQLCLDQPDRLFERTAQGELVRDGPPLEEKGVAKKQISSSI